MNYLPIAIVVFVVDLPPNIRSSSMMDFAGDGLDPEKKIRALGDLSSLLFHDCSGVLEKAELDEYDQALDQLLSHSLVVKKVNPKRETVAGSFLVDTWILCLWTSE